MVGAVRVKNMSITRMIQDGNLQKGHGVPITMMQYDAMYPLLTPTAAPWCLYQGGDLRQPGNTIPIYPPPKKHDDPAIYRGLKDEFQLKKCILRVYINLNLIWRLVIGSGLLLIVWTCRTLILRQRQAQKSCSGATHFFVWVWFSARKSMFVNWY